MNPSALNRIRQRKLTFEHSRYLPAYLIGWRSRAVKYPGLLHPQPTGASGATAFCSNLVLRHLAERKGREPRRPQIRMLRIR